MVTSLLFPRVALAGVVYSPPVDNPVVLRGFSAPGEAYGPGHRGVDFAVGHDTPIRAAATGVVQFAGTVAGHTWVSIGHPDGLVTSYGPLTELNVKTGDVVTRGTPLARLAPGGHGLHNNDQGLHFSVRKDGTYLDPLTILTGFGGNLTLVGDSLWQAGGAPPRAKGGWQGNRFNGLVVAGSRKATLPYAYHPPNANHLVLIGGLATTSDSAMPDPALLGYGPESVTRFSYAGGDQPYTAKDTWDGPFAQVEALRDVLRNIAKTQPGRGIDLVAHSQGGLLALALLYSLDPLGDLSLPPIASVTLLNSPVTGSELAALGTLILDELGFGRTATYLQRLAGVGVNTLPLDAPAIRILDPKAAELAALSQAGAAAFAQAAGEYPSGPLALGTRIMSAAGQTDAVVSPGRTRISRSSRSAREAANMFELTLPGGHGSAKQTDAAVEVMWKFMAEEPLPQADGHIAHALGEAARWGIGAVRFLLNDLTVPRRSR
jgi:hypothetical protein